MSFVTRYCHRCGQPGRHPLGCPPPLIGPELPTPEDVQRVRIRELEEKLGTLSPRVVSQSNGEAGDGQTVCSECGEETETAHTYRECLGAVRRGDGQAFAFLSARNAALGAAVTHLREALRPFVRDGDSFYCGDMCDGEEVVHASAEDVQRAIAALDATENTVTTNV